MPIDINLLRPEKGGNPEIVVKSEEQRFHKKQIIDQLMELDKAWRTERFKADNANKEFKLASKAVGQKAKAKQDATEEKKVSKVKKQEAETAKTNENKALHQLNKALEKIGNIIHPTVPVFEDEQFNKVERKWGTDKIDQDRKMDGSLGNLHHHQVMRLLDMFDPVAGTNLAKHRGYFLKGLGVLLNQALIMYGTQYLMKKGYLPMQPPFFMKKEIMSQTAQLESFDQDLYKVSTEKGGKVEKENDGDSCYLIATSEQPISAYHRKEWLPQTKLPLKYGGVSTCFRKEAGAHGKDLWGIFRVHQFEKVEQFVVTQPEKSWEAHEEMIGIAEEFYQSLELPYQVINIVSGALNNAAAKKYDLEAWFPGYGTYRQLVSCSNCTDYQSRAMEIRCGATKKVGAQQQQQGKKYVHLLNATLCATQRTMCCIVQNYQTEKGLNIPKVLQQYVGTDFVPYNEDMIKKHLKQFQKEAKEMALKQKQGEKQAQDAKEIQQKQAEDVLIEPEPNC